MITGCHRASRLGFISLFCAVQTLGAQTGTLRGSVYDSVSQTRLVGALVQIAPIARVADGRSVPTDSFGAFRFDSLPSGSYLIGFVHPMLDSLGIEPPTRKVDVAAGVLTSIDLAIPLRQLRAAVCATQIAPAGSSIVIGIVRDAQSHTPLKGAIVTAQWTEYRISSRGLERWFPERRVIARENGWFALCGLPDRGQVSLVGLHDTDSTGVVDIDLAANGVARRDLSIGPARAVVTKQSGDSASMIRRVRRTGDVVLAGRVVTSADKKPVAQARVGIDEGPEVLTDQDGEWRIADAPPGSRMLTVRAIGFYPERRVVDVATDAPRMSVSLSTVQAVLDTVRTRATQLHASGVDGFALRRRTQVGRFFSPEDIAALHLVEVADLFRREPGLAVERDATGTERIMMRGGGRGNCEPAIFVDGIRVYVDVSDFNSIVQPSHVRGIEVYTTGGPPQYQTFNGCGSILIWTK